MLEGNISELKSEYAKMEQKGDIEKRNLSE